jgi:hypothetical protein
MPFQAPTQPFSSCPQWTQADRSRVWCAALINAAFGYHLGTGQVQTTYSVTATEEMVAIRILPFGADGGAAQDTPELYGRPDGRRGQNQMQQLLAV